MDFCPRWDADSISSCYLNLSQSLFLNFSSLECKKEEEEEEEKTPLHSISSTGKAITHTVIFELDV